MITIAKVVFEKKGAYILQNSEAALDPKILLRKGLCPVPVDSNYIDSFDIDGNVIRGYLMAKNEETYIAFKKKYQVDEESECSGPRLKKLRRYGRIAARRNRFNGPQYADEEILEPGHRELITDSETGEKRLFERDSVVVFGWQEDGRSITPVFVAKNDAGDIPFYYYGSSGEGGKAVLRNVPELEMVPGGFLERMTAESSCAVLGSASRSLRDRGDKETTSKCDGFTDFLPYPPYEILGAFKLLPPDIVRHACPETLPPVLGKHCFLKTFLIPPSGVPVIDASAGVLRSLSTCTQKNLFIPGVKTEDPDLEYRNLYTASAGYVLLCLPKWPI